LFANIPRLPPRSLFAARAEEQIVIVAAAIAFRTSRRASSGKAGM
jgi:hypothetical protein